MLTKEESKEFMRILQLENKNSNKGTFREDVETVLKQFTENPKIENIGFIEGAFGVHALAAKLNEVISAVNKLIGDNNNE